MPKLFLIVTAVFEAATGVALVVAPSLAGTLLLDVPLTDPAAQVLTRLAGLAIATLGGICWLARDDRRSIAGHAILAAMLFYNVAVVVLLVHAFAGPGLAGPLLWPAVGAHAILTAWSVRELAAGRPARPSA